MLNHIPVEHPSRNMPPTTFLLEGRKTLEDTTFTLGETISHIGERVTRITDRHERISPSLKNSAMEPPVAPEG
jgi:hypothetical protein